MRAQQTPVFTSILQHTFTHLHGSCTSNESLKTRSPPWLPILMVSSGLGHLHWISTLHSSYRHPNRTILLTSYHTRTHTHILYIKRECIYRERDRDWNTIWCCSGEDYAKELKDMLSQLPTTPPPTPKVTCNICTLVCTSIKHNLCRPHEIPTHGGFYRSSIYTPFLFLRPWNPVLTRLPALSPLFSTHVGGSDSEWEYSCSVAYPHYTHTLRMHTHRPDPIKTPAWVFDSSKKVFVSVWGVDNIFNNRILC